MKLKKFYPSFIFLICFVLNGYCQTDSTVTSATKIRPTSIPKANSYNTWAIGVHVGPTVFNGDVATAGSPTEKGAKLSYAFGLNVVKDFSHTFALQGQFLTGKLNGQSKNTNSFQYSFNTNINWETDIEAVITFGNIAFLKRTPNLNLYVYFGGGLTNFSPTITNHNVDGIPNNDTTSTAYDKTTELVFPFAAGIKYKFGKHLHAHFEYSYRRVNTDKMEGLIQRLSEYDVYTYFNAGLTYTFGRKEKNIEWVNPLETIYSEMDNINDKVDGLTGDKDHDGVADIFDKDNNTPPGVKVYGDGTSMDSDNDGVPDYLDADPFSSKGVKVGPDGKELDSDNDGVPDSKDAEPNTAANSYVDVHGRGIPGMTTDSNGGVAQMANAMLASGWYPSVFFENNSSRIDQKYYQVLAAIALIMKNNKDMKFTIEGNCDINGSETSNDKLGQRRADAIKDHFMKFYNIDASRFAVKTKGERDPLAKPTLNSMNRRVDFHPGAE